MHILDVLRFRERTRGRFAAQNVAQTLFRELTDLRQDTTDPHAVAALDIILNPLQEYLQAGSYASITASRRTAAR